MYDYHITMDSFGQTCPINWAEIAAYLNDIIDGMDGITDESGELTNEGRDRVDALWETYCAGELDGAPAPILMPAFNPPYTWTDFNLCLSFDLRDGAERFWEPGYDYHDPDFWSSYEEPTEDFIHAVQMYDWLMQNDPEGR